jgi:hypothetical protein
MKKVCFILAIVFVFTGVFSEMTFADGISPYLNNVMVTDTIFDISDTGIAYVDTQYIGRSGITTGATITVKIEKRNLLVFWKEVVNDVYYFREESHAETFVYQLEKTGTYRCTVDYLISGTGGADDEITFQDTKTYG